MIRREPENRVDRNAVAVFIGVRQIGYLRSGKASFYSRALRALGGSLEVTGEIEEYSYFVNLPRKLALRNFIQGKREHG